MRPRQSIILLFEFLNRHTVYLNYLLHLVLVPPYPWLATSQQLFPYKTILDPILHGKTTLRNGEYMHSPKLEKS